MSVQLDSTDDRALLALAGLLTAVHGTLSDLPLPRGVTAATSCALLKSLQSCRECEPTWQPDTEDFNGALTCYRLLEPQAQALLHPSVVRSIIGHDQTIATPKGVHAALAKWLRSHLRAGRAADVVSGLLVAVVAADLALPLLPGDAFLAPLFRPTRVLLVDAMRRAGRVTPLQALTLCSARLPSELMAWVAAATTRSLTDTLAVSALARSDAERALAVEQATADSARLAAQRSSQEVLSLMKQLAVASTGQLRAEQRAAALDHLAGPARAEQTRLSETLGRTRAHVEVLAKDLDAARAEIAEYQALFASLTEPDATAALAPDLPPEVETRFSGERVFVYTNQARADVRAQMGQRFRAQGAGSVDVFYSDRDEGPERLPGDVLVMIDVTFMPHKQSEVIEERARRAGVPCYVGRHGVSTIAKATAKALLDRPHTTARRPALSLAS